jgi:hypothetical protein
MMGEVAIGYCAYGEQPMLNPENKAVERKWAPDDQIICIADD